MPALTLPGIINIIALGLRYRALTLTSFFICVNAAEPVQSDRVKNHISEEESPEHPAHIVWNLFAQFYPNFAGDEEWDSRCETLPKLGLQRPSVKKVNAGSMDTSIR